MKTTSAYRARRSPLAGLLLSLVALGGCRLEMYDQAKYTPLQANPFFADSQASRPFIPGTVAHGAVSPYLDSVYGEQGVTSDMPGVMMDRASLTKMELGEKGKEASIPFPITRNLLMRGHERFDIYCSPCHGRIGDGLGMIVARGMPQPPSFHENRLREAADGYYYDVITNGFGRMYSYASRIPSSDRWAIIAYIRALQLSQNAKVQDLPAGEQQKLQK